MKLAWIRQSPFFAKIRLLHELYRVIQPPNEAKDIIQIKETCDRFLLRYLIDGARRSFVSSDCTLGEVRTELKMPYPVRFNIEDKIHLLFLNADPNDPLLAILRRFSSENTAFLDIGSNIGFYSYFYLMMGDKNKVFVFEPNPLVVKYLKANIGSITSNIFEVALSDSVGNAQFYFDVGSTGRGSLERDFFDEAVEVKKDKLDNVLNVKQMEFDRFLIKIDVEEHEPQVLKGMREWLDDARPKLVYLEARPHTIDEICDILLQHGYRMLTERMIELSEPDLQKYKSEIVKARKYTNVCFSNDIGAFIRLRDDNIWN